VAEVAGQHDKIIQDTKERNFALVKKVEMLETSDLVKAIGKGARIPAEISQVCGVDGMVMWGRGCEVVGLRNLRDVYIYAIYTYT